MMEEEKTIYLPMDYGKYFRYMNDDNTLNDNDLPYELRKGNESVMIRKDFDVSDFDRKYAEENIHFFRYNQHASNAIPGLGEFIIECHVPSKLIKETFGVFRYKGMKCFPIPEYVMKRKDFSWSYMGINADWNPYNCRNILGANIYPCEDAKQYNALVKDTYKTWKNLNPNNNDPYAFYEWFIKYFEGREIESILDGYKNYYANTRKRVR